MTLLSNFWNTIISFLKLIIKAQVNSIKKNELLANEKNIIIISNGKSAKNDLAKLTKLKSIPSLFCVNSFALEPEFEKLKPKYYLLLDYGWFEFNSTEINDPKTHPRVMIQPEFENLLRRIIEFWEKIENISWDMTLFIPTIYKKKYIIEKLLNSKSKIKFHFFNYSVFKSFPTIEKTIFNSGLATVQCENVINAALFLSIRHEVKNIYLTGIDHDFHLLSTVDQKNNLLISESHFYDTENQKSNPLVVLNKKTNRYEGVKLYSFFDSQKKLHLSYSKLKNYAVQNKIRVYNVSEFSFVQEFERQSIMNMLFQNKYINLEFKKAEFSDWKFLLNLRNSESTRLFSINKDIISEESHKNWLSNSLENNSRTIYISSLLGMPVGMVRVDQQDEKDEYELSWAVDERFRGLGIGYLIVKQIIEISQGNAIARILNLNTASKKIALKCGLKLKSIEREIEFYSNKEN